MKIRALQGWSLRWIDVQGIYPAVPVDRLPAFIYHGTTNRKAHELVLNGDGLLCGDELIRALTWRSRSRRKHKRTRNNVHFVGEIPAFNVRERTGFNRKTEVVIMIDTRRCYQQGIVFYLSGQEYSDQNCFLSANGRGVPLECVAGIYDYKQSPDGSDYLPRTEWYMNWLEHELHAGRQAHMAATFQYYVDEMREHEAAFHEAQERWDREHGPEARRIGLEVRQIEMLRKKIEVSKQVIVQQVDNDKKEEAFLRKMGMAVPVSAFGGVGGWVSELARRYKNFCFSVPLMN